MNLSDISLPNRIAITVGIVVAIILTLALFGYLTGGWEATGEEEGVSMREPFTKWEDRLLAIEVDAIDSAYKDQIKHLFGVWMKDDTGQPRRANVGVRNARRAYIRSMDALERRKELRPQ